MCALACVEEGGGRACVLTHIDVFFFLFYFMVQFLNSVLVTAYFWSLFSKSVLFILNSVITFLAGYLLSLYILLYSACHISLSERSLSMICFITLGTRKVRPARCIQVWARHWGAHTIWESSKLHRNVWENERIIRSHTPEIKEADMSIVRWKYDQFGDWNLHIILNCEAFVVKVIWEDWSHADYILGAWELNFLNFRDVGSIVKVVTWCSHYTSLLLPINWNKKCKFLHFLAAVVFLYFFLLFPRIWLCLKKKNNSLLLLYCLILVFEDSDFKLCCILNTDIILFPNNMVDVFIIKLFVWSWDFESGSVRVKNAIFFFFFPSRCWSLNFQLKSLAAVSNVIGWGCFWVGNLVLFFFCFHCMFA